MNNLAYSTQNIEKVSGNIEEILRKDLESSSPIPFTVSQPDAPKENIVASFANALSLAIFGGKEKTLCNLYFGVRNPRSVDIMINVAKMGLGSHAGVIVFTTKLNKPVGSTVAMEGPKTFGSSKFTGDSAAIAKLNANKELLKLADKFARTRTDVAGGLKMERYVNIEPSENVSVLTIATLPRAYSMGLKATTDTKDFFTIASLIEQSL
ncbi:MAG TPA: hypothetical protein VGO58_13910 [Chitinophagaceae bacterium]|jgi:hypothetical protein|nr:hypothetical protein [Chitinophagaceae bacterium]